MGQMSNSGPAWSRSQIEEVVRRTLLEALPPTHRRSEVPASPRLIVNISARHAHLNEEAVGILFGAGAKLTVQKQLYQEGAFASEQTVTVFGPRKQMLANLRILGPLRDYCQVELAYTDARFLGIDAPVRLSGDHRETPGCYLVGPAGGLELQAGVIRAARHVHMSPAEADFYGVAGADRMQLVVESEQGGTLDGLICRVSPREKLEVHLDTDEGNGLDLTKARKVYLRK